MNVRSALFSISFFIYVWCNAQVREVKSRAISYKNNSERTTSNNSSSEGGFFIDLLFGMLEGGGDNDDSAPMSLWDIPDWKMNLEFQLDGGLNFGNIEQFNMQQVRINFGAISTQVRRFDVSDVTGGFTTIDWQMMQLSIVHLPNLRWLIGAGISHEVETDQTHVEWSTELKFSIFNQRIRPIFGWRQSGEGYPRTEYSAQFEYQLFNTNRTDLALSIGYIRQELYDIPFNFLSIGIGFYLK